MADIDLENDLFTPIGHAIDANHNFSGDFNGNNKSIINLNINLVEDVVGIVGEWGLDITSCKAYGDVTGTGNHVGGFIGKASEGNLHNNFASGAGGVTGTGIDGFVGSIGTFTYSNNYWNETATGSNANEVAGNREGLKTTQMQDEANKATNFSSWDFNKKWYFINGQFPRPRY